MNATKVDAIFTVEKKATSLTSILLKFKVNRNFLERLKAAGFRHVYRTRAEQKVLTAKNVKEAKGQGKSGFELNRSDKAGNVQADSGEPFIQETDVTLTEVPVGIEEIGLVPVSANTLEKEGEKGGAGFLCINFADNDQPEIEFTEEQQELINILLARCYGNVNVWKNPGGSMTVNPSSAHQDNKKSKGSLNLFPKDKDEKDDDE